MESKAKLKELDTSLERVQKKQKTSIQKISQQIDQLINEVSKCKEEVASGSMDIGGSISSLSRKVKDMDALGKVATEHKEFHAVVSKLGKNIDKSFQTDITKAYREEIVPDKELLNQVIAQHLYRMGKFDMAEVFSKEANVKVDATVKIQFGDLHKILEEIRENRNLEPAIEWSQKRRIDLEKMGSSIEFKLHRLNFIGLVAQSKPTEAIQYSQRHFKPFAAVHIKEVQRLMGSLLFIGRLEMSPYASYLSPSLWTDVAQEFTSVMCTLLGFSYDSPLQTCVNAAEIALPKTIKVASLTQGKAFKTQPVNTIELDLGDDFKFHSVFACPVSREQTTPDNPPMLLSCGHAISKATMTRLARNGTRLKCPYCPSEVSVSRAIQITF